MTLTIPDDLLKSTGLTEQEIRIELACRLFDMERLDLWPAAQLAGLTRVQMESELHKRGIPIYRPTIEDVEHDLENLKQMER
jgi:predicted HTH domain antitoxin